MKLQTMDLPTGEFILILSEVEHLDKVANSDWDYASHEMGAKHVLAFEESVEVVR